MKKLLTILLVLCTLTSSAQMRGGSQFDPGSIRANGTGPYADYLKFDADAEPPAYAEGRLFWDKDNGCLGVYPDVNGPILQVGQEFWARVKNPGVATITNGTVVYLDPPTTGKDPVAKLAQANASDTACMLGVVTHDISPDSTGFVTIQGLVRDLHNSEFTAGQRVYLSATTPGSYTASVPAAPSFPVKVGHVVKAHDGAGVLYVKQQVNGAFERAQFAAGANFNGNVLIATSTDDGVNKLQVNGPIKSLGNITLINGGTFNTYKFDLAVGGSVSLYDAFSSTYGILEVVDMGGLNSGGKWFVKAGANISTLLSDYGNAASTDTAGKICVYSAGASVYYIKNNLADPASFHAVFHGLKQ